MHVTSQNKLQFVHLDKVTVKLFCYPKIGFATCFSKVCYSSKNKISSPVGMSKLTMHNRRYIVILCSPLEFACLVDGGLHTLTAYFGHHGSVGKQLTATLAHHHSTICYKYIMILHVICTVDVGNQFNSIQSAYSQDCLILFSHLLLYFLWTTNCVLNIKMSLRWGDTRHVGTLYSAFLSHVLLYEFVNIRRCLW